jgi:hypothetical protein
MGGYRSAQEYSEKYRDAVHAAATATEQRAAFVAPVKCRVVAIEFVSDAAITGDNTNTTNVNIVNKGAAGVGTTEVANKDYPTGASAVALDANAIPLNTTYANGVDLNEGDVLAVEYEKVGTGVLIGPSLFQFDWIPV